ncbi:hypothetical protein HNO89_000912 [Sporosarcina luteola]|nr:hypothetical protein [Sporosarcina luteola]
MHNKTKCIYIPFLILGTLLAVLWSTGWIGLWIKGIVYSTENAKWSGHILNEDYSIAIDLANLQNNIGKELYNDGTHKIYVSNVDKSGDINTGGYRIMFRSVGEYSLNEASLISGIHHAKLDVDSFTYEMSAKMAAEYKGHSFDSSVYGIGGLNYRNGDAFGFYIFPTSAYEAEEVTLNESGIVHLTVTNLCKNTWRK